MFDRIDEYCFSLVQYTDDGVCFTVPCFNYLLLLSRSVLTRPFMSMTTTSRASLADVIGLISQANLSERQGQELRSAVRTVARLLDGEPADIAADPTGLEALPGDDRARGPRHLARAVGQHSLAVTEGA